MSIALLRSGVTLPGATMRVNAGKLKDKRVEERQRKLSDMLDLSWGKSEMYDSEKAARDAIGKRTGVVSFFQIAGAQADTSI